MVKIVYPSEENKPKSRLGNPNYVALNGEAEQHHALEILRQFRKLTEEVLSAAQNDASDALIHVGTDGAADKFVYASRVIGAAQRILRAEKPEDIEDDDREAIFGAVFAFI
jgi:hypothetical protein